MPRPGPRPYECVRRAWHSDRHQPMRGSLIQEIFRMANEVHSSSTRKNKEWQQKLPFVVLKAEEIMYSKANSEAEYVDMATLFERANDAIDTIIRRDDTESGDLLQPCIEAALNLGCIPRRASRSQRHNSPRCYLSSGGQEPIENSSLPLGVSDGKNRPYQQGIPSSLPLPMAPTGSLQNSQQFVAWYSSPGVPITANCGSIGARSIAISQELRDTLPIPCHEFTIPSVETSQAEKEKHLSSSLDASTWSTTGRVYPLHYIENQQNTRLHFTDRNSASLSPLTANSSPDSHMRHSETSCVRRDPLPILHHMLPSLSGKPSHTDQDKHLSSPFDVFPRLSTDCVYPLHYFEDYQNTKSQFSFRNFASLNFNTLAPSRSYDPCTQDDGRCHLHNFLNVDISEGASIGNPNAKNHDALNSGCDLSLRLGPPSVHCVGGGSVWSREDEDVGSSSSHGQTKFHKFESSPSSLEYVRCYQ